jgi:hypothetical protein
MTKVKIGMKGKPKNDPLVIVCKEANDVNIDYEETHSSGITITLDNIPRFVDALMFLHANERSDL